jgi:hypothetical protein
MVDAGHLQDLFRLYDPGRLPEAGALAASLASAGAAAQAAALRSLEQRYSCPGFFAHSAYNFYGRSFDARAALYDPHVLPPLPCAVPLDNVHKASILLPRGGKEGLEGAGGGGGPAGAAATGRLHGAEAAARDQQQGTLLDWLCAELPSDGPLGSLRALREAGALVTVLLLPDVGATGSSSSSSSRAAEEGAVTARGWLRGIDRDFNILLMHRGEAGASGSLVLYPGARVLGVSPAPPRRGRQ